MRTIGATRSGPPNNLNQEAREPSRPQRSVDGHGSIRLLGLVDRLYNHEQRSRSPPNACVCNDVNAGGFGLPMLSGLARRKSLPPTTSVRALRSVKGTTTRQPLDSHTSLMSCVSASSNPRLICGPNRTPMPMRRKVFGATSWTKRTL